MNEYIFGCCSVGSLSEIIGSDMLRRASQLGVLVAEQCCRIDFQVWLLRPAGQTSPQRISSAGQRLLAWNGHVVAPDLPLWPSADVLLANLADAPKSQLAAWDGLFALALFDEADRTLLLAADPFGMQPLYFARCGKGLIFSSSVDLILRSLPRPIALNPTAAAEYLHFHYCLGDKTLANEVERLPQGCMLTFHMDDGRMQCDRSWRLSDLPAPVGNPLGDVENAIVGGLVAALDNAVEKRLRHAGDNLCLLSGGWDSRALAGLMTRRGLTFPTLTTYGDVGNLDDPECARLVADELQLLNTYIPLPPDYLARHWRSKCLASDFATTMHTWLWPLSERHNYLGAVNMDGIAGDVALKGLMLRPEHLVLLGQRHDGELIDALWRHHGVGDALQRCLLPQVAAEWTERARQSLSDAITYWDGHPNALSFFVLGHRTRRAIAASPCLLLEMRLRNVAPFLDREVMGLAMAVPPQCKLSGDLYRRGLRAIRPALANIPSSNDKEWLTGHPRRRRPVMATAALQSYRDEIQRAAGQLSGLVRPEFLTIDWATVPDKQASGIAELRLAQGLGELAFWINEYVNKLSPMQTPCGIRRRCRDGLEN